MRIIYHNHTNIWLLRMTISKNNAFFLQCTANMFATDLGMFGRGGLNDDLVKFTSRWPLMASSLTYYSSCCCS